MENKDELSEHVIKTERPNLPKDYFNSLTENVMSKVKLEPKTKVISFYKKPLFWIVSTAASICVLIGVSYFLKNLNELTFDSLSKSEVLAYVENNIDDFDEELIVEVMSESSFNFGDTTKKTSNLKQPTIQKEKGTLSFESLSEEEILEYLNSQELSLEELEEEIEQ